MEEFQKLRREIRADFALMEARTGELGKRMETLAESAGIAADGAEAAALGAREAAEAAARAAEAAARAAEAAARAAEAAGRAAEQAGAAARESRVIGRECAEFYRWTQGRLRLMDDRFDAILGGVSEDIEDLKRRVTRLEQQSPPAA